LLLLKYITNATEVQFFGPQCVFVFIVSCDIQWRQADMSRRENTLWHKKIGENIFRWRMDCI